MTTEPSGKSIESTLIDIDSSGKTVTEDFEKRHRTGLTDSSHKLLL